MSVNACEDEPCRCGIQMADTPGLTLILGGARSGKSRHAERLAEALPSPWLYVATAQALDEEMRERIAQRRARRGRGWQRVGGRVDLAGALQAAPAGRPVVVDCLTLWLTNILRAGHDVEADCRRLA